MRIRVLTLHFGGAPYLPISHEINRQYCERHGLEFVVADDLDDGRHPLWSKVARARAALAGVEAVLYIDADAVFVDHERGPEHLLERLPRTRAMLIGEDFTPGAANTGVWVVRNTLAGETILDAWDRVPQYRPELAHRWPVDEAGFNAEVLPFYRYAIELVPRAELDLVRGDFIRHHMKDHERGKTLRLKRERTDLATRYGWP